MSLATRAAEQQRTQQGLMVLLAQEMAALWQIITLGEFARTVPEWQAAAIVVCQRYALAAATAAADYYEAEREAAGAVGPFTVELADIPRRKRSGRCPGRSKTCGCPRRKSRRRSRSACDPRRPKPLVSRKNWWRTRRGTR